MIYKEHLIELWINGHKAELESQKDTNVRFQNVLFDPTKISSTQAEYSFEFELPCTPINNKIFDNANNLSKLNKFHTRYDAKLYGDGTLIFEGSLTISSIKEKKYTVNLVSVKSYSLDDIFGDSLMIDISGTREDERWYIDFDGVDTINARNFMSDTDVVFPLISYGVFQKGDNGSGGYTSKFDIDKWNKLNVESFPPSPRMLTTLRKCFEYKDYTVNGDAFEDDKLMNIYMSTNLADSQDPMYNLGNPKFGKLDLTINWTNPLDTHSSGLIDISTRYGTTQDLKFPYFKSGDDYLDCKTGECIQMTPDYNLKNIRVYNMLLSNEGGNVTLNQESSYMFQPNENAIVIPSDGFYKIDMSVTTQLDTTTALTASQWVHDWDDNITAMTLSVEERDVTFNPDYKVTTPLEIQLVRNYNSDIELIKGKNNLRIHDGYPDNTTEMNRGRYANYSNFLTCYPHEKLGGGYYTPNPTDPQAVTPDYALNASIGFMPNDGEVMAYDPIVNPNFICGFTTMGNKDGGGTAAVIKNGYSWSKQESNEYYDFYTQRGYQKVDYNYNTTPWSIVTTQSEFNKNTYPNSPSPYFYQDGKTMRGNLYCMVYLKKNDVLSLWGVHRDYETTSAVSVTYQTTANVHLTIQAASPNSYADLVRRNFGYDSPIEFDTRLRISNFFNQEKKISEWVQNVIDAFNLEVIQNGNNVEIKTKKKLNSNILTAVELDDRVNSTEAESQMIDYPKSMAVKYKIDKDEWGAEKSVVEKYGQSVMNQVNWEKYIDSGYTEIMLNDDSYVTSKSEKSLQFSYTWYDNFYWFGEGERSDGTTPMTLRIPVISKYSYMIDGYSYEESMKHDGKGLAQRFWYKPLQATYSNGNATSSMTVKTNTYPQETVTLFYPTNEYNGLNLSYKNTERSLLTEYFDITAHLSSNYVEIEVYLSPDEYNRLKNGAYAHFDSDLYKIVEIEGYDVSGYNPTTLKMMKKTI